MFFLQKKVFLGSNVPVVLAAVKLCDIQPDHNVLEIGFGPGVGLQEAAKYVNGEISCDPSTAFFESEVWLCEAQL